MHRAGRAFGRFLAQARCCDILPFARRERGCDAAIATNAASLAKFGIFPLNWPSPFGVGPFFWCVKNSSQTRRYPLESPIITTNDRGITCGNSWQWAYWPCRYRPVWAMTFSAVFWARGWAQALPMSRAALLARALLWAGCLARSATTSTSATGDNTQHPAQRLILSHRPNGRAARLAFFAFVPRAMARPWPQKELAHV